MSKIALITGNGMDSKTLAHFLLTKDYKVILTYRRTATINFNDILDLYIEDMVRHPKARLELVFMDITDQSSIRLAIKSILENPKYGAIDELYNFAAQSHVFESFKNPTYTMAATGHSMFYILEAVKDLTPRTKVFQACTSEMFGGDSARVPFDENSPFECRSPYAQAKKVSYDWVQYFRQTHGLYACAAFCFNHSNYYRNPTFFIQKCCLAATRIALGKQKDCEFGNLEFYRDESFSDFCVEAFWKMLQLDKPDDFVIGRGQAFSGEDFLKEAFGVYNLDYTKYIKIDKSLFRDNEVVKLLSNPQKAISKLGWKPNRMPFKDHIKIMCDYDYKLACGQTPERPNVFELYP